MTQFRVRDADYSRAAGVLARENFYLYARWMFFVRRGYCWQQAAHHQKITDALMRVYRGECKRLIINIPPRYSKTSLIEAFIGWTLGHHPDSEYIYTSYSARLASNSTWQVREAVQSDAYRQIFPGCILRDDSQARDEWRTTAGGIVYAAGSGGTITGYGAGKQRDGFGGAIIIDDPLKPDEARSDTIRQNVLDWFPSTLENRTNSPDTPIILIMQRLHETDLSGWLLAGGNGEKWEHVCLPAIQEDGTALWPAKHTIERLREMEKASPYTFSGQYGQSPSSAAGNIFRPDSIPVVGAVPNGTEFCRAWDLASTIDGDWTVGVKLGKTPDGRFFIADIVRLRGTPDEVTAALINTAARDGTDCIIRLPQDPGQAGKSQVLHLTRALAGFTVRSKPVTGDKIKRAEPCAAQANVGNILMLKAPWNDALIGEMRMFPNSAYDDQIDALSDAFDELATGIPGAGMFEFMLQEIHDMAIAENKMRE